MSILTDLTHFGGSSTEPMGECLHSGKFEIPYPLILGVRFQPWVGRAYSKRRPRLLVLGMSHYAWDRGELPDFFVTNKVILDRINGEIRDQFFTNIIATAVGKLASEEERVKFVQSIAFYNYVQEFVGDSPRKLHPHIVWKSAESICRSASEA